MSSLIPNAVRSGLKLRNNAARSLASYHGSFCHSNRRSLSHTSIVQNQSKTSTVIGVEAALQSQSDSSFIPHPTLLQSEFSLSGRVAVVTGAQRGIGLELAEALAEAGAAVYCLDLPSEPDKSFAATKTYVSKLGLADGARLEYATVDVTDQQAVRDTIDKIAEKEGRLDVCIAAAGIVRNKAALDYTATEFQEVMDVNTNGVLFTAQAAGRQMVEFGKPGSIILIASLAGSIAFEGNPLLAYCTSKSAVLQMGRSLASELGPNAVRVNTVSPGYIVTNMTQSLLDANPAIHKKWASQNPLGRIGKPQELRGVVAWLASDASSFCTGSDIIVSGGHHAW